jgi:hypothetical protein
LIAEMLVRVDINHGGEDSILKYFGAKLQDDTARSLELLLAQTSSLRRRSVTDSCPCHYTPL